MRGWQQAGSAAGGDRPGAALERLRRRLRSKDGWAYDEEAFAAAIERVRTELADGLLASSFDGSMAAERAVAEFSARWTARLVGGVRVLTDPPVRSAHVALATQQWHEVAVLKFVHRRFVLQRADLASHQRGQATVLAGLVRCTTGSPRTTPRPASRRACTTSSSWPAVSSPRSRLLPTWSGWRVAARWWTTSPRSPTDRPRRCSTC
jgi:hypothetical protein